MKTDKKEKLIINEENFQIENAEIEKLLKDIGKTINSQMPKGWGFSLLIFSLGEEGSMFYLSSAVRKDMIKAMEEFIEKNK